MKDKEKAAQMGDVKNKKILDVTCGSRTIWFDKNHPAALYCDKRKVTYQGYWKSGDGKSVRNCMVDPDIVCDFTDLPFPDNTFSLVVFDPPHLIRVGEASWLVKKYGKLDDTWPQMLHDGFRECMRVLKTDGILIFKWSECDIPAEKVWRAIGQKPLFGHHSGKRSRTFWGCFMKLEGMKDGKMTELEELQAYRAFGSLDQIHKLVQAEKDGRLVALPCKVGDTLWTYTNYPVKYVYPFQIRGIQLMSKTMSTTRVGTIKWKDIGKTVFLTREEAEAAALKGGAK